MKKQADNTVNFQIRSIELLDFSMNSPMKPLGAETTFNFDINLEHKVNPEKDFLIVVCTVTVLNESREVQFGKLRAGCIYFIEKVDQFINPESKTVELPEPLALTLNSISLSTTRGMMFSLFRGTFLHNAILPIVDPGAFVKQNK
jgi:hypothetical protein